MDPARALLDRELVISGLVHDIKSGLMVVQGHAELYEARTGHTPPSLDRLTRLATTLSDTAVGPSGPGTFRGIAVQVRGPVEVLEIALAGLPCEAISVDLHPEHVVIALTGVPARETSVGWSYAKVEQWLAKGGPGLAGARLRIAARIVGAVRCSFPVHVEGPETSIILHLAR